LTYQANGEWATVDQEPEVLMSDRNLTIEGIPVPRFLYGTAWKEQETRRLTELALRQGFRRVDTANQRRHYDESAVGQAVAAANACSASATSPSSSSTACARMLASGPVSCKAGASPPWGGTATCGSIAMRTGSSTRGFLC